MSLLQWDELHGHVVYSDTCGMQRNHQILLLLLLARQCNALDWVQLS